MKCSPGSLVFQKDMLFDVLFITDLLAIGERRELLIDENLKRTKPKMIALSVKLENMFILRLMMD